MVPSWRSSPACLSRTIPRARRSVTLRCDPDRPGRYSSSLVTGLAALLAALARFDAEHPTRGVVLWGPEILYVRRAHGHRAGQYEIDQRRRTGSRAPAHCTAARKIVLAGLSQGKLDTLLAGTRLARHRPRAITSKPALLAELGRVRHEGHAVSEQECGGQRARSRPRSSTNRSVCSRRSM